MNPNASHNLRLDLPRLEMMIRQRRKDAGLMGYSYPGQLVDSDYEVNGADSEDEVSSKKSSNDEYSDYEYETKVHRRRGGTPERRFDSSKLINGYKDFLLQQQKLQDRRESEESTPHKNKQVKIGKSTKSSASLSASFDWDKREFEEDDGYEQDDDEFDLNISFSGGYVPNTDLTRVDKGQGNPQF
jgi:hypothetical protein